jgi:hypothetical protein
MVALVRMNRRLGHVTGDLQRQDGCGPYDPVVRGSPT